ncbi:unnamed protein product, partial [marine sediment metagenome]
MDKRGVATSTIIAILAVTAVGAGASYVAYEIISEDELPTDSNGLPSDNELPPTPPEENLSSDNESPPLDENMYSPWPMSHGDIRHTGQSPYDTSHVD